MKEELSAAFGKNLTRLRLQKRLTQRELAGMLHVDHSMIAKLEGGKVLPRNATIERLAQALGASAQELTEQAVEPAMMFSDQVEDPELMGLLGRIAVLDARDRETLKEVIEAMLTRYQLRELVAHPRRDFSRQRAG
jgi:transcriptional regulator with XRE-family HTH domain